jgi:hypothetical protein
MVRRSTLAQRIRLEIDELEKNLFMPPIWMPSEWNT